MYGWVVSVRRVGGSLRGGSPPVVRNVITVVVLGAVVAVSGLYAAASYPASRSDPISQEVAIADAMRQLPNNGSGYSVLEVQFEPTSKHFEFSSPVGHRFGEDGVKERLVVPPLPPIPSVTPCRYYPVWAVALSNPACDIIVAINAYTALFPSAATTNSAPEHPCPPVMCELAPASR